MPTGPERAAAPSAHGRPWASRPLGATGHPSRQPARSQRRRLGGRNSTRLLLAWGLVALGCGSISDPLPPLLNIPERSHDFTARQTAEGLVMEWTWPLLTTEGMPLTDVVRFTVYGLPWGRNRPAPSAEHFERESRLLASVEGRDLEAYGPGDKVRKVLPAEPLIGTVHTLGVRAESSRSRWIGFSNLALIDIIQPPGPAGRPKAVVERDAIRVEWTPGEGASAYLVFRGEEERGPFTEVGHAADTHFQDPAFAWNRRYYYRLTSLAESATGQVEGATSPLGEVFTSDTFAPLRPSGLRAVPTDSSVELSWKQNRDDDLAGYRLQRATGESPPVVLNDRLLETPRYSDSQVVPGQTYRYTVSAIDREGNESEPSEPVEVVTP